ncbi:MAG: cytidylyltransferase [Rhodospirillaceae bacterium]|nr:cytidylyltransferase [Rhodospirillaceae bacterium]
MTDGPNNPVDSIAIVPARGGSKGVPGKNLRPLLGHPLIAYSIAAAQNMHSVSRVIVSTDSAEIAAVSRAYGADVPFMRPAEFATDTSVDREFLIHAMTWLIEHEGHAPEYFVHLRPTTPMRDGEVLDRAVLQLMADPAATSLRSAHVAQKNPYKWFEIAETGYYTGIRPQDTRPEYYNLPRQAFPAVYDPNGYIDVVRTSQVLNHESVHGPNIAAFITDYAPEVDTEEDLELIEFLTARHGSNLLPPIKLAETAS